MVKPFKNLLLWNLKADDLEIWYAASGTRVLPSLFKWYPRIDPDIFYGKIKMLLYKKKLKQLIFHFSLWYKSWEMQSTRMSTWGFMSTKGQGHSLTLVQFNQNQYFFNSFSSITADLNISSALMWVIQDQWSSGLICGTAGHVFWSVFESLVLSKAGMAYFW